MRAAVESGLDGLVVVSPDGRMIAKNHRFVEMWPIPDVVAASGDDNAALLSVLDKLEDPDGFLARVRQCYADPSGPVRDELSLRDGRVFDRYGTPLRSANDQYLGWAWYFRDVTVERAAAREALEAGERFATLARTLQESLLPPHLPDVPGVEIAARYLPAGTGVEVVGDFYDVFQASASTWAVTIGDVSGKGVEAAKVTALARYTIRAGAVRLHSPAEVLTLLNDAMLRQHPDSERFVTAAYMSLEQSVGGVDVRLALAGHPRLLLRHTDGRVEEVGEPGTILGCFDRVAVTDTAFKMATGELLVLYTDGVVEARRDGSFFGDERLRDLVADCDGTAAATAERIEAHVIEFSGGPQSDDTATLVIRVPPE